MLSGLNSLKTPKIALSNTLKIFWPKNLVARISKKLTVFIDYEVSYILWKFDDNCSISRYLLSRFCSVKS